MIKINTNIIKCWVLFSFVCLFTLPTQMSGCVFFKNNITRSNAAIDEKLVGIWRVEFEKDFDDGEQVTFCVIGHPLEHQNFDKSDQLVVRWITLKEKKFADSFGGSVSTLDIGDCSYLSFAPSNLDNSLPDSKRSVVRYTQNAGKIEAYLPNTKKFADLIKHGKLAGKVNIDDETIDFVEIESGTDAMQEFLKVQGKDTFDQLFMRLTRVE